MISSGDPDPDSCHGTRRARHRIRQSHIHTTRVHVGWSRVARRALANLPGGTGTGQPAVATLNQKVRQAVRATLRQAPIKNAVIKNETRAPYEIDVTFVTDAEIAALNTQYRGKARPTDVLSFSQYEESIFESTFGSTPESTLPALGPTFSNGTQPAPIALGDIVISIETARRQAIQLSHGLDSEVAFLAVHGALHLCGYNHHTASARRIMWKWQEEVLARIEDGR